jgi:hypothetical protein
MADGAILSVDYPAGYTGPRTLPTSPAQMGSWAVLDPTARANMDAEMRAQGFSPTGAVDYNSSTAPSYIDNSRSDVAPFGSTSVPVQSTDGRPAVPAGSTATAYGSTTLTNMLGAQWPFILGGALLVIVLMMRE